MKDRRAMLTVSNYKEFFRIGALTRFVTSWSYEIWNRTGYTSTISDWVPLWLKFSNWVSVLTTIVRWSTNASHLPRQDPHLCRLWPTSVRVRRFRSAALLNSCHAQHCFHCHLSFLPINEKQTTCSPCSSWRKSSHHLRSHHCTKKRILWRYAEQIVFIVHIDVRFSWSAEPKHVQQTKYNRGDYRPGNGCIGTIVEKTAYWKVKASSQCARYIVLLPGLVLQFGGQCWRNRRRFPFYFLEFWRR